MGFGAGFGEGFTTAFNQQRQRSHERETDEFRYRMETLIKKKDKYDEGKREGEKMVNRAKQYVEMTGQPPEAVGKVYEMLVNGMDESTVLKQLQGGKFKVNKESEPTAADNQTQDAGLATPQTPESTTSIAPAPQTPEASGGLLSKIFPGMKKFSPDNGVEGRVQKTTGMSPEEIAQVDAGYTPPQMDTGSVSYSAQPDQPKTITEAKIQLDQANKALQANPSDPELQAAVQSAKDMYTSIVQGETIKGRVSDVGQASGSLGTIEVSAIGPDGKRTVVLANSTPEGFTDQSGQPLQDARPRTKEEVEMANSILEKLGKPALKHQENASNLAQAYTAYGIAEKIIAENPEVLQERTAGWTQWLIDLGKDAQAAAKIVDQALADPENADPGELDSARKVFDTAMNNPQLGPAQKLAAAKGLLNVQYAIGAYHVAASKGQEGKALSDVERKMFQDLPNQATSPAQWKQLIGSVLVPTKQVLDKQAEMLPRTDPRYDFFERTYGYSPVGSLELMEKYLEGTEGADLDRTLPQSGYTAVTTPNEAAPPVPEGAPPEEGRPVQVQTQEDYDKLPSGTPYIAPDGTTRKKP